MVALGGACVVAPGGHVWLLPGECAWLLQGGMRGWSWGEHVWDTRRYRDTINERVVPFLLECILVRIRIHYKLEEKAQIELTKIRMYKICRMRQKS